MACRAEARQSEGWWSRRVTLPHQLACRASALLVCPDPGDYWQAASVLPRANGILEILSRKLAHGLRNIGSPSRSREGEGWCGCRELHPDMLRGGETFWLLNHSRKESKKAGSCVSLLAVRKDLPAHAISTKN